MTESRSRSPVSATITILALVFLFVPLVLMVLFSFHSTGGLTFPFEGFSLRWYDEVFSSPAFRSALKNSAIVATCVAAVTLVLGTAAAYGLSRMPGKLRVPLAFLFFLPITLPGLFLGGMNGPHYTIFDGWNPYKSRALEIMPGTPAFE